MLSEEEKKAIKVLEQYKQECIEEYKIEIDDVEENIDQQHISYLHQQIEATKTVSNLVDKLQKEIENKDRRLNRQYKLLNKEEKQIKQALDIAFSYGQTDGAHHKAWVIDQIVRALTGKKYDKWINNYIYDEETGDSYNWDKGIAP